MLIKIFNTKKLTNLTLYRHFTLPLKSLTFNLHFNTFLFYSKNRAMQHTFNPVPEKEDFSKAEEGIIEYWTQIDAFKTQLERTKGMPEYTFYDGPPFATGLPHYGNLLAGICKDICTRYASQNGFYVSRRFGWDCHGLPVEHEIDKKLQIKGHEDYEKVGISKYNNECRQIIMRYSQEWEHIVSRFGRWIDFKNDYKTMDLSYMESVWWVFQQFFEKGLVYQSSRVMPVSTECGTVLSNFEAGSNYKDVSDPSLIITFPTLDDPNLVLLGWTTTPWTLPSNMALAVNPQFTYLKVKQPSGQIYIIGEPHLKEVSKMLNWGQNPEIVEKVTGKDLKGIKYDPLFPYFKEMSATGCFQVLEGDFVTKDTGTGIVHCAPGFGEEDFNMCVKAGIVDAANPPCPVDNNGRFLDPVSDYKGLYIKKADPLIKENMKKRGRMIYSGSIVHSYPFCWRSDTPLIYKAIKAWFIKVTDLKDDLLKNNMKSRWVPKFVQEKRFHNWLLDAKDWCFSRNRYWGNPIPIWVSDDGEEVVCIGSIEELQKRSGVANINDLHRDYVDQLEIDSEKGKGKLKRIPEVFDCWFESGSMPFAQSHYPFSISEEEFMSKFPADFCSEGLDQTRGWFYTMNVISTTIKNMEPFKNLIVHGLVLAEDGKKMSKSKHNFPDPLTLVKKYGADSIRLYLVNSPVVKAEPLRFKEQGLKDIVKDVFLPWYNAYRFMIQNITRWEATTEQHFLFDSKAKESLNKTSNIMDRWIVAANQHLIEFTRTEFENYRLYSVVPKLLQFLENLTNWYVRLNRNRIKGLTEPEDWKFALNILFDVLLSTTVLMSPYTPMMADYFYQNLKKGIPKESPLFSESIHFLRIPSFSPELIDEEIEDSVKKMQGIIELGRLIRQKSKNPIKSPLQTLSVVSKQEVYATKIKELEYYIKEELNIFEIEYLKNEDEYLFPSTLPNFQMLGSRLETKFDKKLREAIQKMSQEQIAQYLANSKIEINGIEIFEDEIKITKEFKNDFKKKKNIGCACDSQIGVILNLEKNEKLKKIGTAREICTKIQKTRKAIGVNVEDKIEIFYSFPNPSKYLEQVLEEVHQQIGSILKVPLLHEKHLESHYIVLGQDKYEAQKQALSFKICYAQVTFNEDSLKTKFGELEKEIPEFICNLKKCLQAYKLEFLQKMVQNNNGKFGIMLNGKEVVLEHKVDFFFGAEEKLAN